MTTTIISNEVKLDAGDHTPEALESAAHNFRLVRDAWCNCATEGEQAYYNNPATGQHGWMCEKCHGITQTG